MNLARLFALPLLCGTLCAALSGCTSLPAIEARVLHFQAGPVGESVDARRLLVKGLVPADKLVSIPEALAKAPAGSVLLACWRDTEVINFWGPCSHVARKLGGALMADQPGMSQRAGVRSTSSLLVRYAVIVLDVGVKPEQLPALNERIRQLDGQMYSFSAAPDTSYCSDYQNELQRALGLPDVISFNSAWNGLLPADVLNMPGVKVLWVGVNEASL